MTQSNLQIAMFLPGRGKLMEEEWKVIEEFPDYEVSNMGRVRRPKDKPSTFARIMTPCPGGRKYLNGQRYLKVMLRKDGKTFARRIHKLVTTTFLGKCPEELQVNHKDGIKANNQLSNLEYISLRENVRHACKLGLWNTQPPYTKGYKHPASKLSETNAIEIRRLNNLGISYTDLSKKFGTSKSNIGRICKGQRWPHLNTMFPELRGKTNSFETVRDPSGLPEMAFSHLGAGTPDMHASYEGNFTREG